MQPIYVAAPHFQIPDAPPPTTQAEVGDLLRHLIVVQRDQSGYLRGILAAHDSGPKWKAFLARWQDEFPDAGAGCKAVLPAVERAFLTMVTEVTERLSDASAEELESDYALGEFLDKYGTRLSQLAGIINHLTPLAENALRRVLAQIDFCLWPGRLARAYETRARRPGHKRKPNPN